MYFVGRFLQLVGLGIAGFGCIIAFDSRTTERTMWTLCLVGAAIFFSGHRLMPKK